MRYWPLSPIKQIKIDPTPQVDYCSVHQPKEIGYILQSNISLNGTVARVQIAPSSAHLLGLEMSEVKARFLNICLGWSKSSGLFRCSCVAPGLQAKWPARTPCSVCLSLLNVSSICFSLHLFSFAFFPLPLLRETVGRIMFFFFFKLLSCQRPSDGLRYLLRSVSWSVGSVRTIMHNMHVFVFKAFPGLD